jgi:hypothetical protein
MTRWLTSRALPAPDNRLTRLPKAVTHAGSRADRRLRRQAQREEPSDPVEVLAVRATKRLAHRVEDSAPIPVIPEPARSLTCHPQHPHPQTMILSGAGPSGDPTRRGRELLDVPADTGRHRVSAGRGCSRCARARVRRPLPSRSRTRYVTTTVVASSVPGRNEVQPPH